MVFVRAMADPNDLVSLIGFTYGGAFARLPEEALPVLLDTMKRKDASLRSNAACELSRFGAAARQALPLLEKAIHDSDVWVRHNAALAIWRIAHDADGVLLVYVSHSQPEFQGTAFQAARHVIHLMVAEDAGATSGALLRLLIDPSPETRLKTCRAIASVVDKCKNCRSSLRMMHLSEALRQRLEDKDPEVRNAAADALFRLEQ
jgi:HEAT repeat protein